MLTVSIACYKSICYYLAVTLKTLRSHAESVLSLDELVALANELLPDVLPKDASGRVVEEVNPRLVRYYTTQGLLPEPRKDGREARYLFEHLLKLLAVRRLMAEGFSSQAIRQLVSGLDAEQLITVLQGGVEVRLVPAVSTAADEVSGVATGTAAALDERLTFLAGVRQRAGLEPLAAVAPHQRRAGPGAAAAGPSSASQTGSGERSSEPPPTLPAAAPPASQRSAVQPPAPLGTPPRPSAAPAFAETNWTSFTVADGLELFVRSDFSLPATRLGDEQLLELIKLMLLNLEQRRRSRP